MYHRYFGPNHADAAIPLVGTFHDGAKEAVDEMNRRFMERAARWRRDI